MTVYTDHYNVNKTPQNQPIPGSDQVKNSAGGYVYQITPWERLRRFLILGTEGGTYYVSEQKHTLANVGALQECLRLDGLRVVNEIVTVSDKGLAFRNDAAIFALAVALKDSDLNTRRAAADAVPKVCRIGTHIFQLAEAVQAVGGGWGRVTCRGFTNYYASKDAQRLALDLFKYQQRNGWAHRDVMLKAHVGKADQDPKHQALYRYVAAKGSLKARSVTRTETVRGSQVVAQTEYRALDTKALPDFVTGIEKIQGETNERKIAKLIVDYQLPREVVPTQALSSPIVWDALLRGGNGMPMTAMLRNLAKMTAVGLLRPMSDATKYVVSRLKDPEAYVKARVHPMAVLLALRVYEQGCGLKGSLSWVPEAPILKALDQGFYKAFGAVEPTGLNWLMALDVSGSMGAPLMGTPLTARDASCAMALVTMNTEESTHAVGFTSSCQDTWGGRAVLTELPFMASSSLSDAVRKVDGLSFGGTDCALPMLYATKNKIPVDVFVVLTDSETWAGGVHPSQALKEYRQKMGRDAKLIVVGMTSTGFTIADPQDPRQLDVVGFDVSAPQAMSSFAKGWQ